MGGATEEVGMVKDLLMTFDLHIKCGHFCASVTFDLLMAYTAFCSGTYVGDEVKFPVP